MPLRLGFLPLWAERGFRVMKASAFMGFEGMEGIGTGCALRGLGIWSLGFFALGCSG